jgi:hypothetical protein
MRVQGHRKSNSRICADGSPMFGGILWVATSSFICRRGYKGLLQEAVRQIFNLKLNNRQCFIMHSLQNETLNVLLLVFILLAAFPLHVYVYISSVWKVQRQIFRG